MALRKEKVEDKFQFNIASKTIPTITQKLDKSLGKVTHSSQRHDIHPFDPYQVG